MSPPELTNTWGGPPSLPVKEKRQVTWGEVQRLNQGHLARELTLNLTVTFIPVPYPPYGAQKERVTTGEQRALPLTLHLTLLTLFLVALCDNRSDLSPMLQNFSGLGGKTGHRN